MPRKKLIEQLGRDENTLADANTPKPAAAYVLAGAPYRERPVRSELVDGLERNCFSVRVDAWLEALTFDLRRHVSLSSHAARESMRNAVSLQLRPSRTKRDRNGVTYQM